jgi:hypothetical protein
VAEGPGPGQHRYGRQPEETAASGKYYLV